MVNRTSLRKHPTLWTLCLTLVMTLTASTGCALTPSVTAAQGASTWEAASAQPLRVPLRVDNPTGSARLGEPVTSGIPIAPESGVTSTSQLRVSDGAGHSVPAQFRVLSRWGRLEDASAPIRWVLVDFQAEVPPQTAATYYLERGSSIQPPMPIKWSEAENAIEVSTGRLIARIPKRGSGILAQLLMTWVDDGSRRTVRDLLSGPVRLRVDRAGGPYYSQVAEPSGVAVEEAGPVRTVVRIRGTFRNAVGALWTGGDARPQEKDGRPKAQGKPLEFEARLTFMAGKPFFKLAVTLENNGNGLMTYYPINDTFFDGMSLEVPWRIESAQRAIFPEHDEKASPAGRWLLTQAHIVKDPTDEEANFVRHLTLNDRLVKSGRRNEGWAVVCDELFCGGIGIQRFWQDYPKSLAVEADKAVVGLWPTEVPAGESGTYGAGGYFFSGGWHKTYEVILAFWPARNKDLFPEPVLLNRPLFAVAPPAWHVATKAWGLIAPSGFQPVDRTTEEAVRRYERFRAVLVDPTASDDGVTLERLRETRGLAVPKPPGFHFDLDLYGWEVFGELPWGGNGTGFYSALHYDWPFIMWLHFIRSGDPRYPQVALEMTDHNADLDQIHHHPAGEPSRDGVWWWEQLRDSKGHHRSTQGAGAIISHTWNGGYALGYLLTGNPRYLAATEAGAMAGRRYWFDVKKVNHAPVIFEQTRSQGWSILMLVNLYRIDGRVEHLQDALTIFANSLLFTEQSKTMPGSGGHGFIAISHYPDPSFVGKAVVTFLTYPLEPLAELHYEAARAGLDVSGLEAYLIRALDWLKDFAYVGGESNALGEYSLLTLSYATDPENRSANQGGTYQHNMHVAGAFGYGYLMLKGKDPERAERYLRFARRLFRDLMFYRGIADPRRGRFYDPAWRGPIRLGWPGTYTKELGWISRSGQSYLHAEYELSLGRDTKPRQ